MSRLAPDPPEADSRKVNLMSSGLLQHINHVIRRRRPASSQRVVKRRRHGPYHGACCVEQLVRRCSRRTLSFLHQQRTMVNLIRIELCLPIIQHLNFVKSVKSVNSINGVNLIYRIEIVGPVTLCKLSFQF